MTPKSESARNRKSPLTGSSKYFGKVPLTEGRSARHELSFGFSFTDQQRDRIRDAVEKFASSESVDAFIDQLELESGQFDHDRADKGDDSAPYARSNRVRSAALRDVASTARKLARALSQEGIASDDLPQLGVLVSRGNGRRGVTLLLIRDSLEVLASAADDLAGKIREPLYRRSPVKRLVFVVACTYADQLRCSPTASWADGTDKRSPFLMVLTVCHEAWLGRRATRGRLLKPAAEVVVECRQKLDELAGKMSAKSRADRGA